MTRRCPDDTTFELPEHHSVGCFLPAPNQTEWSSISLSHSNPSSPMRSFPTSQDANKLHQVRPWPTQIEAPTNAGLRGSETSARVLTGHDASIPMSRVSHPLPLRCCPRPSRCPFRAVQEPRDHRAPPPSPNTPPPNRPAGHHRRPHPTRRNRRSTPPPTAQTLARNTQHHLLRWHRKRIAKHWTQPPTRRPGRPPTPVAELTAGRVESRGAVSAHGAGFHVRQCRVVYTEFRGRGADGLGTSPQGIG